MRHPRITAAVCTLIIGGSIAGIALQSGHRVKTTFNSISNTLPDGGPGFDGQPLDQAAASPAALTDPSQPSANNAAVALTPDGAVLDQSTNATLRNRKIIRAADIQMRSSNVTQTSRRVSEMIQRDGGYLSAQDGNFSSEAQITLEYRIPSENFDHVLTALSGVATIESTRITSSEVTAQYVDLDSRIKTMRLSADRLRELLTKAARSDIINLENELTKRDADIAALQGQFDVLADQVSLSRISLTILTKQPAPKPVEVVKKVRPTQRTFGSAFTSSVHGLTTAGRFSAIVIGGALPFVPFVLLVWGSMVFVRRRVRARQTR